jgi:hypothetical protein
MLVMGGLEFTEIKWGRVSMCGFRTRDCNLYHKRGARMIGTEVFREEKTAIFGNGKIRNGRGRSMALGAQTFGFSGFFEKSANKGFRFQ